MRLDTLVRLRWLAIIGQTTAVLVVYYGLDFELPVWACLAVIALSAWLNVALRLRFHLTQRLEPDRAAWLLAFDIAELAVLLFLTGGLQNPFAFLFLGPVLLSATALPPRFTLMLGGFAVACATVLVFVHYPLPWDSDDPLQLPPIYMMGVWLSILLAIGFIGVYAWQITEESRQLADALAATELVLAREQHLSQLDGLAAAAAHELGTPLSTISVIAKELENAIPAECAAWRRRAAAARAGDALPRHPGQDHRAVVERRAVRPHAADRADRGGGGAAPQFRRRHRRRRVPADRDAEPLGARNPAILYGLGNLLENAVDFASERVEVAAHWNDEIVDVTITDDGPGFAPEIMDRIGEPYVTSRRRTPNASDEEPTGLGSRLFHRQDPAGTLRRHAVLRQPRAAGARRQSSNCAGARADFERPLTFAGDLEDGARSPFLRCV